MIPVPEHPGSKLDASKPGYISPRVVVHIRGALSVHAADDAEPPLVVEAAGHPGHRVRAVLRGLVQDDLLSVVWEDAR